MLEFVFLFVAEVAEWKQPTKGEKYDRVAGQMQNFAQLVLHCCTFGVAHLHSCTVAQLNSYKVAKLHFSTVGVALPCDPIRSRDPGNQVELIATLAIKLASSESNLDFSNQLLLIVDF